MGNMAIFQSAISRQSSIQKLQLSSVTFILKLLGNDEEHIGYCFDIYDLNGDGMISREEMLTMLKTSLGRQGLDEDPDEGVKVN